MKKISSFRDLVADKYYNALCEYLSSYVEDNPEKLDSRSYIVDSPDQAELSDIDVKFVDITHHDGSAIHFDVIVSAEIEISERRTHSDRESDSCEQWFRLGCGAEINDSVHGFSVSNIRIYNGKRLGVKQRLSEYLVPIIYKEQLDEEAEKFLSKYYPEALETPTPVPPREVASRMGLDVREINLTKNCSIFGQIYFSDCDVQYYDGESKTYRQIPIKRGTILVDPVVYFLRTVGSVNNTIMHECVHWDKHKLFFELERLYNQDAKSISCRVREGTRPNEKRAPLDWMEWQANALAPRIQMPAKQTRIKIEELIEKNMTVLQTDNISDIMESVVFELSEFFVVSKIAAKIRMIDLGYTEATGVYTYIDNHYISNYTFERTALKQGQTFTIGAQDALVEYATNFKFRAVLDSGYYAYVDGHYCINAPKYICYDNNGDAILTDYARQHIDECCLVFDIRLTKNSKYGAAYYTECVLYRNAVSDTIVEAGYGENDQNQTIHKRAYELKKAATQLAKIKSSLPASFSETLKAHMEREKCTVERLAEKSLLGTKTVQRMRNGDDYSVTLESVIAVCIGLHLPLILSMDLVAKAGFKFKATEEHITYQLLLGSYNENSIYECNELLVSNGFKQLGREE